MPLYINELFHSVQGEGMWTGMPMTFVRLQGCNLRCSWCDTPEALQTGINKQRMPVAEVVMHVRNWPPQVVCLTGGEPLLQLNDARKLCEKLAKWGVPVHLETNGTIPLSPEDCRQFSWITVSPKPPHYKCEIPLEHVNEMKFVVVGGNCDFVGPLRNYLRMLPGGVVVWLQPCNNDRRALEDCLYYIRELGRELPPLRLGLSVQVHKLLSVP